MPQLRAPQLLAITALEWLFSPDQRQQGRSTVIAITLIRMALRSPGLIFPVVDHAGGSDANRMLASIVMDLIDREPLIGRRVRRSLIMRRRDPQLCIDLTEPIESWLPREWTLLGLHPQLRGGGDPRDVNTIVDGFDLTSVFVAESALPATPIRSTPVVPEKVARPRTLWDHLSDES